jgi:hypothetical protein
VFPGKAFCTQCTEEEFVIGTQVQWYADSVSLLLLTTVYVAFPFPSVISSGSRQVEILGEKKLMSENREMTLSWRGGRG